MGVKGIYKLEFQIVHEMDGYSGRSFPSLRELDERETQSRGRELGQRLSFRNSDLNWKVFNKT